MKPLDRHLYRQKHKMTVHAEIMLDLAYSNRDINVLQLMNEGMDKQVGSYMTVYNAIVWLGDNGFLKITKSMKDRRAKHCNITKKGVEYYENV